MRKSEKVKHSSLRGVNENKVGKEENHNGEGLRV